MEQGVKVNLHQLLRAMIEKGASDMHITTGAPPLLRIDGQVVPLKLEPLGPIETKQLCYSVLTEEQKIEFEKNKELDLSFGVKNLSRFRANIFLQRGAVSGAFRSIPFKILSFEELGLPAVIANLTKKPRGLILVTGPTGSGKSTTLASIIDKINSETRQHIMTVEDPIEYLHPHKKSVVNQREIGSDTGAFKTALKYVLRQDPDVVLVGEPHYRCFSAAPTGAGSCATVVRARGHHQPAALASRRRARSRARARSSRPERRHPQSHPRRQSPPNLFADAGGPSQPWHADLESVTLFSLRAKAH
jgi:pilus retraction protein PilT